MRYLARHEERQRFMDIRVVGELHQVFVNQLGARLGREVAAQVYRQVAIGMDIRRAPGNPLAVAWGDAAAGDDRELRVGKNGLVDNVFLGSFTVEYLHDLGAVSSIFQFAVNT